MSKPTHLQREAKRLALLLVDIQRDIVQLHDRSRSDWNRQFLSTGAHHVDIARGQLMGLMDSRDTER